MSTQQSARILIGLTSIAVIVAFGRDARAVPGKMTGYAATGDPSDARPLNAGADYIDSAFGTQVTRITTAGNCAVPYAYWPAFNVDDSIILAECAQRSTAPYSSSYLYDFNKANHSVSAHTGGTDNSLEDGAGCGAGENGCVALEVEGAYWSNSAPNIIYALGGQAGAYRLYRIDVSQHGDARFGGQTSLQTCSTTNTLGCLKDFSGSYLYPLQSLQKSENDDVFAFRVGDQDATTATVGVYILSANQLSTWATPTGESTHGIHGVQISKNASYTNGVYSGFTYITYHNGGVYEWPLGSTPPPPAADKVASDAGHSDIGRSYVVAANDSDNGMDIFAPYGGTPSNILTFAEYQGATLTPLCGGNGTLPCFAEDISIRNFDETIALTSTYTGLNCVPGQSGCTAQPNSDWYSFPFHNEIVLAYTDNSSTPSLQQFVRIAHTNSVYTADGVNETYYHEPHANIDKLSQYVAFTSDFGVSTTSRDVYVAKIPRPAQPTVGAVNSASTANTYFHVDLVGRLWQKMSGGSWQLAPNAPATVLSGGLARLSSTTPAHDSVAAVGTNGHVYLYYNSTPGTSPGTWYWFDGGAPTCSERTGAIGDPGAFSSSANGSGYDLGVVVKCGPDEGYLEGVALLYYNGSAWTWAYPDYITSNGSPNLADPLGTPAVWSDGSYWYIDTLANDGNMYEWWSGSGWSSAGQPSMPSGDVLAGSPAMLTDVAGGGYDSFITDSSGNLWAYSNSLMGWVGIGQGDCPLYGEVSAVGVNTSDQYIAGRCKSGDKIATVHQLNGNLLSATWSWDPDITFSQSPTYSGNMPLSQPSMGAVNNVPRFDFETTAGEQLEATHGTSSWTTSDNGSSKF